MGFCTASSTCHLCHYDCDNCSIGEGLGEILADCEEVFAVVVVVTASVVEPVVVVVVLASAVASVAAAAVVANIDRVVPASLHLLVVAVQRVNTLAVLAPISRHQKGSLVPAVA